MTEAADDQLPEHLRYARDLQITQLQEALGETRALAAAQGCGVTVRWCPMDAAGRMQFEMVLAPDLEVDQVRYVQVESLEQQSPTPAP